MSDIPTIEINYDVACRACGEKGATNSGLCLRCAASRITGLSQTEGLIREKILAHISELLESHWGRIVEIRDQEESEVTIGLNVNVDASGKRPLIKTKIRYAKTFTDECEEMLKDPEQTELAME